MELNVRTTAGAKGSEITVSEVLFGARMNADLVYQVATSQMSNQRRVIAHTKTRAEVRGGGKKPWRQKGTGRARHGSIRSPIWVGGGVAHGPNKEVNFKKTVTRIQARKALAVVLSSRVTDGHLAVVASLTLESGKTKDAIALLPKLAKSLTDWKAGDRVLVVLPGVDDAKTLRALANIPWVHAVRAQDLNALTVLSFPYVIITQDALAIAEKVFASKKK